ncbi:MAG: phosphatidylserine/phosphatidylglycerophosphate/cardiolipin synthase family protein [Novosphingobium sp.]|nr:phosphatidylserine/phosphatidylglycerophosphate/cardiolipin synthase family protein [Novosphingobium sp.]MCP5389091.1 phosphatidylserine/phosphatidylglycerophosphate/cardiolipin synthase family protein [Novosphingobium sp.]
MAYRDPDPFSLSAHGHELTFYPCGQDRLRALIDIIGRARTSLHVYYYLFEDDSIGEQVRNALAEAARRGVAVRLIVDGFGTAAPDAFFEPIVDSGGSFATFNARRSVRYLIRNHQKLVIADDATALIGGFNVSEHYFAPPSENGWHDLGLEVQGPVVSQLTAWFDCLARWTHDRRARFGDVRRLVREWSPGDGPVRLLIGGPTRVPNSLVATIKRDLARATRLDLVMAYFSPPLSMRRLIRRIAGRGTARLVMAARSDNGATIGAARSLYTRLLKSGAAIYEFLPCKLHMKLLVIDDAAYVGSANFDMRSLRLNLEMMLRVDDAPLAAKLREMIDGMTQASEAITLPVHLARRNWFNAIRWKLSFLLVGVLDYTVTRRLNLGLTSGEED